MSLLSNMAARIPALFKTKGGALALVAALQLGALSWMVAERVALLKGGREVVLPIVPVDPRDLFKGDFVRLAYPISTVPIRLTDGKNLAYNKRVYVTLQPEADATWSVAAVASDYPGTVATGQIILRGTMEYNNRIRFGLERYYVPEGKGPALEKLAREKKLAAIVAVDRKGIAAIKGLSADGQKIYDEPLF
jgi:uncharacterized membrane-anchored protein